MTRKRGKSRSSSATKRARRWKEKYALDPLTKRAKKLLPNMYPQMRTALINWDWLEVLLFPKFVACGVPEVEYPNYMAWAKRKAELGLSFDDYTRAAEKEVLKAEFVTRGLDAAKLDCIEPTVDTWIDQMTGEKIVNGGFEADLTGWVVIYPPVDIVTYQPHTGLKCCRLMYQGYPYFYFGEIRQTLGSPVEVSKVKTLGVWARREHVYANGQLRVFYSDATTQDIYLDMGGAAWTYKDYKGDLLAGKTITAIGFRYYGEPPYAIWVDDVSLTV